MSSFIKKEVDCDDVDLDSFHETTECNILKDENKLSSNKLMAHQVKAELPPPDEVTFEGSIKEEEYFQEEREGSSNSHSEAITKPEIVWLIKSEMLSGEDTLKEECGAFSMEYKGLMITPKLEEIEGPDIPTASITPPTPSPATSGNSAGSSHRGRAKRSKKDVVDLIAERLQSRKESHTNTSRYAHLGTYWAEEIKDIACKQTRAHVVRLFNDVIYKAKCGELNSTSTIITTAGDNLHNLENTSAPRLQKNFAHFNTDEYNQDTLLPTCEQRTFDGSTLHPNLLDHCDKMQVIQDYQQIKPISKEKPNWNLSKEEEIADYFIEGQCSPGLNAMKQSKEYFHVNSEADTSEKSFKCDHCYEKFGRKGTLQRHLRIHTGEKPFECSQCNQKFKRKGHLQIHLRIHTGEKPYECSHCHKKCSRRGDLQKHFRIHTGEKPFECSQCNRKFSEKGILQRHLRTHTGEKPFECSQCNKKFSQNGSLHHHLKIHTGEKPFECSQCNKKFSQNGGLQYHLKVHTGEKPFECSQCNKSFRHKLLLQRHLKVH